MINFELKRHRVIKASFDENMDKEKKKSMELVVEGNIMIPKKLDNAKQIMIKLRFHLGSNEDRMFLVLETLSAFEMVEGVESELTEEIVQQKCLPVALANLRKTVKMVSEAYGLPSLDLAPFEGEEIEK